MDILTIKRNHIITGRASAAIYGVLKSRFCNRRILLPCNICYAAVYPVIYSGNTPVFCDVDETTGNVTLSEIEKNSDGISAMIIPHMFGNPVGDIAEIQKFCKDNSIMLIEDCASSMGAEINGETTGSFGDYVIYSLGYSKTVDIGYGGILCSDEDMSKIENELSALPLKSEAAEEAANVFSKKYRIFRNSDSDKIKSDFLEFCKSDLRQSYLFMLNDEEERNVRKALKNLPSIIAERREKQTLYENLLNDCSLLSPYNYSDGSVPWRFNFFAEPEKRRDIIDALLEKSVPISDWYPVVSILFGDNNYYAGGKKFENSILNLPLLIKNENIQNYTDILKKLF